MKNKIKLTLYAFLALFLVSCSGDLSNLKKVSEQSTGDFNVSVLNDTGELKSGKGTFVVEFRKVSDGELVKVGSVSSEALMQMAGSPMTGETTINFTDIPGRYNATYNLPMKGTWNYIIYFNNGLKVQLKLNVI